MKRNWMIGLAMAGLVLAAGALPSSALASSSRVELAAPSSVVAVAEYVDTIDRRLQDGRYDNIDPDERSWIIDSIAGLRKSIEAAGPGGAVSEEMARQSSEFELGMIKIEEGGIVCRRERPTGSRMTTQRCYSKKRLEEDARRNQSELRNMRRPQRLPTIQ